MRYYYEPINTITYKCAHVLYNNCTLYTQGDKGLAVVQQRWNSKMKMAWWGPIDKFLVHDIPNREGFDEFFQNKSDYPDEYGIYPTVSIRKLMYSLKMKPLRKTPFEEDF